jgi:hypothetical protein
MLSHIALFRCAVAGCSPEVANAPMYFVKTVDTVLDNAWRQNVRPAGANSGRSQSKRMPLVSMVKQAECMATCVSTKVDASRRESGTGRRETQDAG